jgi:hypothetical protein
MRTVFFILLTASLLSAPICADAALSLDNGFSSLHEIHPQTVNRLLGLAAESLQLSHGDARKLYNDGRITISAVQQDLNVNYDVSLDGVCIFIYIEDL